MKIWKSNLYFLLVGYRDASNKSQMKEVDIDIGGIFNFEVVRQVSQYPSDKICLLG